MHRWTVALCLALWTTTGLAQEELAPKNDVTKAEHFLKKLEDRVKRANGEPLKPNYEDQQALSRIKELKEKYPNDPAVEDLFQRARKAFMTSKGDTLEITPDMLAYRDNENKMKQIFAQEATTAWQALLNEIQSSPDALVKPFPAPRVGDSPVDKMKGRYVILEDFRYPTNEFMGFGQSWVFVGARATGFYYVSTSDRDWVAPYEAVKRYRRLVNSDVPEGGPWTLLGRISGLQLLVPQAEEKKTVPASWGWSVDPVAIYVPDRTFAKFDPDLEKGSVFAGEANLEQLKSGFYTAKSIPDDVTPERLLEIYFTAIKEKNFPLYTECIDPDRRKTPTAMSLVRYHWDLHQERFARFYVHVTVDKTDVKVTKGFDPNDDFDSFFLTDDQKDTAKKIAEPTEERGMVTTKAWDERGRQYGSAKPHQVRRLQGGRWYVYDFAQQF